MKKVLVAVGCALVFAAQAKVRYVDCEHGSDANSGVSLAEAFKTIRAATTNALSGDIIYVAPGTYGEKEGSQVIDGQSVGNRVLLPAGVTLESLEGAEKTFIVGAADPDAYTANYGTGPKAIRCVHAVGIDTHIRGFTLTGGHSNSNTTDTVSSDANGAAVYSSSYACVEDCIVSNNFCYGATLNSCRVIRCRVTKNRSIRGNNGTTGAAGSTCYWYGCIVDDNYGKGAMNSPKWIESCTIKQASGMSQVIFGVKDKDIIPFYNSVLISGNTYCIYSATNCMFLTDASTIVTSYRANCIDCVITNATNMKVDSKFSPVFGSYAGIDAGSVKYASEYLGDKDIYGNPRVMNGKMDIGAVEYDWRPNYAALLGQDVTVETASSAVHSTDDAVVVPSGSALAGTLTRVGVYKVAFQVSGEGTATFTFDGKSFGEYVAGDYVVEVESFGDAPEFGFAFEGDGELVIRSVTFAGYWYVNGTLGNDNNDGRTTKTPKATIRAATTNAVAGEVIYVAPGDYGEAEGSRLQSKVETRVIVPEGVRLQADGAPYSAVIHGAAASAPEDAYGNGPDAVRCVYLSAGATLANFTLMDGHTPTNTYGIGSAVYAANNTTATVTDCLVTNNFCYNGTLYSGNIVRCRVVSNRAIYTSCIGNGGRYYGCFFDKSYSEIRPLYVPVSIDFCTLGPDLRVKSGSQIIGTATKTVMRNSVMMYGSIYLKSEANQKFYATNCVFTSVAPTFFTGQSNCVQMALASMKLSADGVPAADSPLNNWGDVALAPDCVNETDLAGVPRVLNGGVDAGAFEHDWRVEYKNDLGPRATSVDFASPEVVETENHTVRISSGTLVGTLKLGGAARLDFTVKNGTFEVYQGTEHKTVTATEETQASVELWPSEADDAFRLVFTPSAADGYAEVARLKKGANGIIFIVR